MYDILALVLGLAMTVIGILSWIDSLCNSEERKIRGALKKTPRCAVRDAKTGQVAKLVGAVRPSGELLRAPLSNRKCVLYEVIVEEFRREGRTSSWVEIVHETKGTDFLIDDGTECALVNTGKIKVVSIIDTKIDDATPTLEAFLTRHGLSYTQWRFNKKMRCKEGIFEADETIAVFGTMKWQHDPNPHSAGTGYRDAPERLVVDPLPDGFVLASDMSDTHDG